MQTPFTAQTAARARDSVSAADADWCRSEGNAHRAPMERFVSTGPAPGSGAYPAQMQPLAGRSASWDGHLVLFHENERQRRAGVVAWFRRGLELGAKIFYIESPDVPEERSLAGSLRGTGIAGDEVIRRGQLQVFSADDGRVYDRTWQASMLDEALADGFSAVRWSAEADTAWSVMPRALHADLEWATDDLCHTRPVSVLCQYSAELRRRPWRRFARCTRTGSGGHC